MAEPLNWARVPHDAITRQPRTQRFLARWLTIEENRGRVITKRTDGDDTVFEAFARTDLKKLSLGDLELPDLTTQLSRLRGFGATGAQPWQRATIREALGVPAIFRANSLIANTTGSLAMRALRNGAEMAPEDRPPLIIRPDPNRTPRDFYRDTAWNLGRAGEAWWYVTKRDGDGLASALYNVPDPAEVQVQADPNDAIRPVITWRGKSTADGTLRRDDMRQLTFLPSWDGLRGMGPLQACGAAWSVSVQSQNFAANFYAAGGYPNIWIKTRDPLSGDIDGWSTTDQTDAGAESEAERIKLAWISTAPNTPHVSDDTIEDIKQFEPNVPGAQMLEARNWQNGEAARAYGIPGSLLEYQEAGSSLTYQNLEGEFTKFIRGCLRIGYLETIEQAMSDLLTRSTVSLFNTEQLEAPDVKTRFEVYALAQQVLGIDEGAAYARKREGLAPGNVENAPVPFGVPVVVPRIVASTEMRDVRCPRCRRLIVRASGSVEAACRHCKVAIAS